MIADGLVYHVLNRGNNGQTVFTTPDDSAAFQHALAQTQQRYPFQLYAYCLMSDYSHLLLQLLQPGHLSMSTGSAAMGKPAPSL